jgi:ornithine cyclodeaminase
MRSSTLESSLVVAASSSASRSQRPLTSASQTVYPLYLSVADVVAVLKRKGLKACITGIAENIRADFLRWDEFDKCARVANHSAQGVIELMPISDPEAYSFMYVNAIPATRAPGCRR